MQKFLASLIFFVPLLMNAQVRIIPEPAEIKMPATAGQFVITPQTPIVLEGSGLENSAAFLNDYLQEVYGFKLPVQTNAYAGGIRLNYERMDHPIPGAYNMEVRKDAILINGDNANGVFYGIQTLIQLLPLEKSSSLSVPYVEISDFPRFQYRGLHLDVARHFFPVEYVKKYIDYIALHKMNTFHWHLTDDQGWRIEIKKYPKLTSVGGYRDGTIIGRYPGKGFDSVRYGGYYTQEQVKEVVEYAAKRYINVIPEIEMPGHASAALTAYPSLGCTGGPYKVQGTWGVFEEVFCAGNDEVFTFLQDVLDEVMPLFPSKYIHVGGDECPKESWKKCPKCQQRIKDLKLKDEHELQSYFVQRMEKYINSKGKIIIGWDEILEGGLAPNAVVMSWRGVEGGITAARQNHDVIMTPTSHMYFDYSQTRNEDSVTIGGYIPLEKVYNYEPIPDELNAAQAKHILGAQANLWTEYIRYPSKVEYHIFPRLSALSEVLWSPKEKKDWGKFEQKLEDQFKRYALWKANYSKAYYDLKSFIRPAFDGKGVQLEVEPKTPSQKWTTTVEYEQEVEGELIMRKPANTRDTVIKLNKGKRFEYFSNLRVPIRSDAVVTTIPGNGSPIVRKLQFNKATGKHITIAQKPAEKYSGDGAFTLVNGVINERGLSDSESFLGFEGSDMEAVIDLGSLQKINSVTVFTFSQPGSWIYHPNEIVVSLSVDGKHFTEAKNFSGSTERQQDRFVTFELSQNDKQKQIRYVKVFVKNYGLIPSGQPGAGHRAWLFIDEIQVN